MTLAVAHETSIVIIDPDKVWLDSSWTYLSKLGYKPRCFLDVESAIRGNPFEPQTLVIASYDSFRKGGNSVRRMRLTDKTTPKIILLLDSMSPSLIRSCFKAGASDCLLRPSDQRGLANLVESWVSLPVSR